MVSLIGLVHPFCFFFCFLLIGSMFEISEITVLLIIEWKF